MGAGGHDLSARLNSLRRLVVWGVWVLGSSLAVLLGSTLTGVTTKLLLGRVGEVVFTIVGILGIGIIPAMAQWIVLRKYVPKAILWVLATGMGWLIGALLGLGMFAAGESLPGDMEVVMAGLVLGAAIGAMQWIVLRRHFSRSGWWVLGSSVAWGVMSLAIGRVIESSVEKASFGAIPASVTGIVLILLLAQPKHDMPGTPKTAV